MTGSADSIGRQTAQSLVAAGHQVVLHARSEERAEVALDAVPGAVDVIIGDLASIAQTRALAEAAAKFGRFDAVVHNAGISHSGRPARSVTGDGLEETFQVNVLAPYLLTAVMPLPQRLVYLTSGLESEGVADLADLQYERRPWSGRQAYCDSKMYDVVLAFAIARRYPEVVSNAVDPGWIKTRMGGPDATDELPEGAETQIWLAVSEDSTALTTGRYLKRRRELAPNPAARERGVQDALFAECARLTGIALP